MKRAKKENESYSNRFNDIKDEIDALRKKNHILIREIERYMSMMCENDKSQVGDEMKIHEAISLLKENGYRIIKRVVVEEEV